MSSLFRFYRGLFRWLFEVPRRDLDIYSGPAKPHHRYRLKKGVYLEVAVGRLYFYNLPREEEPRTIFQYNHIFKEGHVYRIDDDLLAIVTPNYTTTWPRKMMSIEINLLRFSRRLNLTGFIKPFYVAASELPECIVKLDSGWSFDVIFRDNTIRVEQNKTI